MKYEFFEKIEKNPEVEMLIRQSEQCLRAMNYTEHGKRHICFVSRTTEMILEMLGYDEHTRELGKIAGYLHDIGNIVNRNHHGITSAMLAYSILKDVGMDYDDIGTIMAAIGNHEEGIGTPVNVVGSALIIADKSDAHRTRVNRGQYDPNDIHDRVNYSILKNTVTVDSDKREICSRFYMTDTSSVMEYFQIYLSRIVLCEKSAKFLNCTYKLFINDSLINSPKTIDDAKNKIIAESRPE